MRPDVSKPVPDALARIPRDFCHVEWSELDDLKAFVERPGLTPAQQRLVGDFERQLADAIDRAFITPAQYEGLTADQCETTQVVVARLKGIMNAVFER
ncbi:MAG: hypothetical protein KDG55_10490 [Rhodocyclaceae bacterium]|nr:hypothetical protein [Rhodocyclaceae bacterium]